LCRRRAAKTKTTKVTEGKGENVKSCFSLSFLNSIHILAQEASFLALSLFPLLLRQEASFLLSLASLPAPTAVTYARVCVWFVGGWHTYRDTYVYTYMFLFFHTAHLHEHYDIHSQKALQNCTRFVQYFGLAFGIFIRTPCASDYFTRFFTGLAAQLIYFRADF